jgi:hypothetical protein
MKSDVPGKAAYLSNDAVQTNARGPHAFKQHHIRAREALSKQEAGMKDEKEATFSEASGLVGRFFHVMSGRCVWFDVRQRERAGERS